MSFTGVREEREDVGFFLALSMKRPDKKRHNEIAV